MDIKLNKLNLLNNLFKYYDLVLRIDNVLGTQFKKTDVASYSVIEKIDKVYKEKLKDSYYFSLDSNLKNNFVPIDYLDENTLKVFTRQVEYFEKAISFEGIKLKKGVDSENIDEHSKFIFSKNSNFFQYGIAFNLVKEKPLGHNSKFVPSFVILFPNYDEEFQFLTPDKIFIEIKRFMGYELTEEEEEFSCEIKPYLVFNSKILEPYSLEIPNIKLSTFKQTQKEISEFLKSILESDKYEIEKEFQKKPFILGISQNLNMGLTKIYDTIFEHQNINRLIQSYFHVDKRKMNKLILPEIDESEIITTKKVIESYASHYGSFDKEYPLAQTQREAFSCYLENKDVLPVNGAPGTGKTSLLRGIFGDYTVKAALKSYENYIKNKVVLFSTPIVCSSTNNQALTNISEGIDSGFLETIKKEDNKLYKRWLADDMPLEKKTINFHESLFVPSIRSKIERKYELTKNDMSKMGDVISKDPLMFINEYLKYRGIEEYCEKIDKRTLELLNKAANFFYNKIKENIDEIEKSICSIRAKVVKLSELEVYLVTKYIKKGIQEDLIKATLFEIREQSQKLASAFDRFGALQKEHKQLEEDKKNLEILIQEHNEKSFKFESIISTSSYTMEMLNQKITIESSFLNDYKASPLYSQCCEETKYKYRDKFTEETNKIIEKLRTDIQKVFEKASVLDKIAYGILKKGNIKQSIEQLNESSKQHLSNLQLTFYQEEFFTNDLKETIINKHEQNLQELKIQLNKAENEFTHHTIKQSEEELKIYKFEKELDEKDIKQYQLEKHLDEAYGILANDFFELEDIEKLIEFETVYKELNVLNEINKKYDTKQRTDNFYFALHLLEALYFIANTNMWNTKIELNNFDNKVIKCPICHDGTMVQKNRIIGCSRCHRKFSFNNNCLPKELDEDKILYILKHGKATIDDISYYASATEKFINISTKTSNGNETFTSLYPLFPLINITCNSFGTIVSEMGSNYVKEDIFDFLLIDEAGTIPPSKMIILNCAKKVMFFGDTKQLKPVFAYDSNIENRILEDFFSSEEEIKSVAKYFSCASKIKNEPILKKNNNSMDIANSSTSYFLPYNKSKMEGDIWLKEHFRCQTPIVQISNELSYFNEIVPLKQDKYQSKTWSILLFIEHENEKYSNNTNQGEVKEIIKFIKNRKDRYINEFLKIIKTKDGVQPEVTEEDYYNSIGIITPFVNQENLLKKMIIEEFGSSRENKNEPIIKVGTVHKYQGSERDIIIFSSVYNIESKDNTLNFFFNKDEPDMINVAVTRAKEVFVLFGNSGILNYENTYSGVMVKHILEYQKV